MISAPERERAQPWWSELNRFQWTILIVAWLGWVFDIMDAAIFNFAKVPMLTQMMGAQAYKEHGAAVEGNIQAFFLLGWALGGLIFGMVADRFGRTRTMVLTILIYSVFTGLTALCAEPWQVGVARFITALGVGGEWAAGAALVAEVLPNRARAAAAALLQTAAAIGPALAALANLALKNYTWHWLFIVGVAPALICVVIRMRVKEPDSPVLKIQPQGLPLARVFQNPVWRRNALIAAAIGVVGVTGPMTVTYWLPNLVKAASEGLAEAVVRERTSFAVLASHVGTFLGVLVVPLLCERFGRKRTILSFFIAAPIVLMIALSGGVTYERLLFLSPFMNFFVIGVSAAFVLYFPELFPRSVRATGAGFAYNVGRVFSIFVPAITGALIGAFNNSPAAGVLLTGSIYILGIAAVPFGPETRGKALPEEA